MAFVRPMGAESVAYHEATVLGREDDHPGAALDYYGSRGETPLRWGGRGTRLLGLSGPVESRDYKAIYGPGGAADPDTRIRLANTKRPGMELVVSAHKSVAELGVIGRADDMHAILDAERDATLEYLEQLMCERGGRRGRTATPTQTGGLVYAHTRHATTRAGDPGPHDHVLIANVVAMFDERGGWKGAHTVLIRDHVHAATAAGRMAAARKAIELGYGIVSDNGPSGKLRHWAIAGVAREVMDLHSKRSDEIDDALDEAGFHSYRARGIAARTSRSAKRFEAVDDLLPRWRQELTDVGWQPDRIIDSIRNADTRRIAPEVLHPADVRAIVEHLLGPDSPLARLKVFSRRDVMVEAAPFLYGLDPGELDRVADAVLDHGAAIPLVRRPGADEQPFAPACVLAIETAITRSIERAAVRRGAPSASAEHVAAALDRKELALGHTLTSGQRAAVEASTEPIRVVAGPGTGKTRVLTRRVAHLVESGARASSVLALTFTNRAANELRERLEEEINPQDASSISVGTFHRVCLTMLRDDVEALESPIRKGFAVYDQAAMIKLCMLRRPLSVFIYERRVVSVRDSAGWSLFRFRAVSDRVGAVAAVGESLSAQVRLHDPQRRPVVHAERRDHYWSRRMFRR